MLFNMCHYIIDMHKSVTGICTEIINFFCLFLFLTLGGIPIYLPMSHMDIYFIICQFVEQKVRFTK